jgi:hypothetical protein
MDYRVRVLQDGITQRQHELHNIATILARAARRNAHLAAAAKVITIVFGAIAATSGAATTVFGEANVAAILAYTLVGLIIAAVGGLEAAFKLESRGVELKVLAALCQSTLWQIDTDWQKTVGTSEGEEQIAAMRQLLDRQDQAISDIQARAAEIGVNITFKVRELYLEEPPALA